MNNNSSQVSCPVCANPKNRKLYDLEEGYLANCCDCGLTFYLPRPTPQDLVNFYNSKEYREGYGSGSMTGKEFAKNRYQQFIRSLGKYKPVYLKTTNKSLFDVGCGAGDFLASAADHGWQIEGIEISEVAAQQANQLLGKKCVHVGTVDTVKLDNGTYDLVTSYHVIEHLLEPMVMLQRIYDLLRPGGVIFLETPNINSLGAKIKGANWSHITPPEHITYFQPSSLKFALKKIGFIKINTYTIRPQKIESLQIIPSFLRPLASSIYGVTPLLNMGASLQAIATKPESN